MKLRGETRERKMAVSRVAVEERVQRCGEFRSDHDSLFHRCGVTASGCTRVAPPA